MSLRMMLVIGLLLSLWRVAAQESAVSDVEEGGSEKGVLRPPRPVGDIFHPPVLLQKEELESLRKAFAEAFEKRSVIEARARYELEGFRFRESLQEQLRKQYPDLMKKSEDVGLGGEAYIEGAVVWNKVPKGMQEAYLKAHVEIIMLPESKTLNDAIFVEKRIDTQERLRVKIGVWYKEEMVRRIPESVAWFPHRPEIPLDLPDVSDEEVRRIKGEVLEAARKIWGVPEVQVQREALFRQGVVLQSRIRSEILERYPHLKQALDKLEPSVSLNFRVGCFGPDGVTPEDQVRIEPRGPVRVNDGVRDGGVCGE